MSHEYTSGLIDCSPTLAWLIAPQLKRGFHNLEKYYKNMPRERFIPLPDVRTILSARNRFVFIMQQEIFIYVIENQYTCSFCFGVIPIKLSYLKIFPWQKSCRYCAKLHVSKSLSWIVLLVLKNSKISEGLCIKSFQHQYFRLIQYCIGLCEADVVMLS
jgi:hypothetical protein